LALSKIKIPSSLSQQSRKATTSCRNIYAKPA
jgi:hypothetical protein